MNERFSTLFEKAKLSSVRGIMEKDKLSFKRFFLGTSKSKSRGIKFASQFRQHPERQHGNVGNAAKPHEFCMIEERSSLFAKYWVNPMLRPRPSSKDAIIF